MNKVRKGAIGKLVLVYLGDTVIYSRNEAERMLHFKVALELRRRHKLYARLSKCTFARSQLKLLGAGHVICIESIQVDPVKISVVEVCPVPQSKHESVEVLGLANYFRKVTMGYAKLVAPLLQLT